MVIETPGMSKHRVLRKAGAYIGTAALVCISALFALYNLAVWVDALWIGPISGLHGVTSALISVGLIAIFILIPGVIYRESLVPGRITGYAIRGISWYWLIVGVLSSVTLAILSAPFA